MICFGVANALAAGIASALAKLVGREPVMLGVMVLHSCIFIFMREWVAVANDYLIYCTIAALWGLADGIWLVQVNGMYNDYIFDYTMTHIELITPEYF